MAKCGAQAKTSGKPCQMSAMENGRCRMHGGNARRGIDAPGFKTGRYSKYLPTRLLAKYEEALADPKLLEMRDELALIDTRLREVLEKLDSGESGQVWRQLVEARNDLIDGKIGALSTIIILIARGAEEWARWDELFKVLDRRSRLAESERRRLVEQQQMMSNEQALVLLGSVVETIRRHVKDRDALVGISADLSRIMAPGASAPH